MDRYFAARKFPLKVSDDEGVHLKYKSKDYFDDASMELVRHNLFQLSSIEGMDSSGPPSAITFHSTVIGKRCDPSGKVHVLLHWSPEDMIPDSWIAEADILSNLQKTIPLSKLPPHALQLPSMVTLDKTGIVTRLGKRKRK
ncbi:zinc finger protein AEBP2 [Caerostris extrusa]|uniref:Zinc finger protein AEBP2 n=1 Tax=Caerostris extrusa TaxID=172846 RepID=A0AAV4NDK8_CAEEX|nr:zinc finger protein AEBP2 [Caerostris extrusa]